MDEIDSNEDMDMDFLQSQEPDLKDLNYMTFDTEKSGSLSFRDSNDATC